MHCIWHNFLDQMVLGIHILYNMCEDGFPALYMDNVKCYYATYTLISLVPYVPNDGFLLSQNTMRYNHKRYQK